MGNSRRYLGSELWDVTGLGVTIQTKSLSGDVLAACDNTSLNTWTVEPGKEHPWGCSEARGRERGMNQFRMLRMSRVSKEPQTSVRTPYRNRNLPGKQPTVGTRQSAIHGQTTTISPSSPLPIFRAIALAPTKSTWKDDKIHDAILQSSSSACS